VISLDTNVLIRILLRDDPRQADTALAVLDGQAFVSLGVLIEAAWVLRHSYGYARKTIADALAGFLSIPGVSVPNPDGVDWALSRSRDHESDLADLLHIAGSGGTRAFVTFDRKLPRQAGPDAPLAIEVLR